MVTFPFVTQHGDEKQLPSSFPPGTIDVLTMHRRVRFAADCHHRL
jgi:hypothetical protein